MQGSPTQCDFHPCSRPLVDPLFCRVITASIVDSRKETEKDKVSLALHGIGNATFLQFAIEVRHVGRTWIVWRRYRQFENVRKALGPQSVAARTPLPPKGIGLHMTSKLVAAERRAALEAWLRPVMQEGAALAHPAFLDFIGFPGPEPEVRAGWYAGQPDPAEEADVAGAAGVLPPRAVAATA